MAVTGKLPFESCVSLVTLAKKIKGDVPPPRELVPDLSEQVDEAIRRAMSPDPTKRPQSCLQFAQLLPSSGQWGRLGEHGARSKAAIPKASHERRTSPRHPCTLGCPASSTRTTLPAGRKRRKPGRGPFTTSRRGASGW